MNSNDTWADLFAFTSDKRYQEAYFEVRNKPTIKDHMLQDIFKIKNTAQKSPEREERKSCFWTDAEG